jgi:4'-phosphopantetheinyl transferase
MAIAERFFSAEEALELAQSAAAERWHAFYRYWSRKEAYAKARGEGLTLALRDGAATDAEWRLHDLAAPAGYAAAIAYHGPLRHVRVHGPYDWVALEGLVTTASASVEEQALYRGF